MTYREAKKRRGDIEVAAQTKPEASILNTVWMLPKWKEDTDYVADGSGVGGISRVQYDGKPYKCTTAHRSQSDWRPDVAHGIWSEILPGQDGNNDIIQEWVQPNATNTYQIGDKVLYNGKVWICTEVNNSHAPGVWGWEEYMEET